MLPDDKQDRSDADLEAVDKLDNTDLPEANEGNEPLDEAAGTRYLLRLYVTGATPRSTRSIANIKAICEEHLNGRYELDVVDIYQQPWLAREDQVIAAPTLIKKLPLPLRRMIGDLSDEQRVLVGLNLLPLE